MYLVIKQRDLSKKTLLVKSVGKVYLCILSCRLVHYQDYLDGGIKICILPKDKFNVIYYFEVIFR